MAQRFDILVSQQFGEFVAPINRQDGRDRIKLLGPPSDGGCSSFH
jgi:hypothetical protein